MTVAPSGNVAGLAEIVIVIVIDKFVVSAEAKREPARRSEITLRDRSTALSAEQLARRLIRRAEDLSAAASNRQPAPSPNGPLERACSCLRSEVREV